MDLTLNVSDSVATFESLTKAVSKPFADAVTAIDSRSILMSKSFEDAVAIEDNQSGVIDGHTWNIVLLQPPVDSVSSISFPVTGIATVFPWTRSGGFNIS